MKTTSSLHRVSGWSVRFGIAAVAVAFGATAFAGVGQDSAAKEKSSASRKAKYQSCYALLPGSAIPQPCERLNGPTPTTAIPTVILGEYRVVRR
ncbi:MAG TPA: hypothetical protein VF551_03420 [Chthoniobacterales bacterium]